MATRTSLHVDKLDQGKYRDGGFADRRCRRAAARQLVLWRYRRRVPTAGGSTSNLGFDDCFLLQDEKVVIARASVTKFATEIATLSVFYVRE